MNHTQALRQAALREMEIVRDRYGYANPLFWGAFVYLGEPGPDWASEKKQETE